MTDQVTALTEAATIANNGQVVEGTCYVERRAKVRR